MAMQSIEIDTSRDGICFDGPSEFECEVAWTNDFRSDGDWHTALFYSFGAARRFAREIVAENEGNEHFAFFAKRLVVISSFDFLDDSKCVVEIPVCDRVVRPDDLAAEVEVDNAPSGNTERVYEAERIPARR